MRRFALSLLVIGLSLSPALAQDGKKDEPKDAKEDPKAVSYFLEGDKFTCKAPPLRISRPHDAWQFVDLEAVKKQRRDEGLSLDGFGSLRFQLYYGAARADIFINAWVNPTKVTLERAGEHQRDQTLKTIRDGELKSTKKVRVGKQVGTYVEIAGNIPDPKDMANLKAIMIHSVTSVRPADMAVMTLELRFAADNTRAKDLAKDFKKLLKKAKF